MNITLDDLDFSNKKFWSGFIVSSFPTALDEKTDMALSELIEQNELVDIEWWDNFTGYYDGILEKSDGYIDKPKTFIYNLTPTKTLKIEFHPCDIIYYINNNQIGCTGAHYNISIFPFMDLLNYLESTLDNRIFLLLLPLTIINEQDIKNATKLISNMLSKIFGNSFCDLFANSIVYGLMEEHEL